MPTTPKPNCKHSAKTTYTDSKVAVCSECGKVVDVKESTPKPSWTCPTCNKPAPEFEYCSKECEPKPSCPHETIGRGMIEHDGIKHAGGPQICLDCRMPVTEIFESVRLAAIQSCLEVIGEEIPQPEDWEEWTNEQRRSYLKGIRNYRSTIKNSIEKLK